MKLAAWLLASLTVFGAGALSLNTAAAAPGASASAPQTSPRIVKARLEGKKLILEGENFNIGAVILINGKKQKTKNDSAQPANVLIAKKGGKKIGAGSLVSLQVKNPGSSTSDAFGFFSGLTVTLDDGGKAIQLKVGEKFMLLLKKENLTWTPTILDPSIIKQVDDASIIPGAQGIFQAEQAGSTSLVAVGELPCHRSDPPCLAPSEGFEVRIVVQ
jgi:hypothetical protein